MTGERVVEASAPAHLATLPVILILKNNQACVLLAWDETRHNAKLLLPETGQGAVKLSVAELAARHTGLVLFVRPHFRFDSRTPELRAARSKH